MKRLDTCALLALMAGCLPILFCVWLGVVLLDPVFQSQRLLSLSAWRAGIGLCAAAPAAALLLAWTARRRARRDPGPPRRANLARAAQIVAVCSWVLSPAFFVALPFLEKATADAAVRQCQSHIREAGRALDSYLASHRGVYPDAARWTDELRPYLADPSALRCPADATAAGCSYALNASLSRRARSSIAEPNRVVVFFECDRGANARGGPESLPRLPRHDGSDVFLCADGNTQVARRHPKVANWFRWTSD